MLRWREGRKRKETIKSRLGEVKPAAFCSVINGQERKEAGRASLALLLLKGS